MKIVIRSQNMLKIMDQIKQQDISKVNIEPSGSRQWEVFWKKCNEQVRIEKTLNQPSAELITNLTRGRSLMVGPVIDEKVRKFLVALFRKGRDISYRIASTTANVLLSRNEDLSIKNIKTIPMWGRSILQRLGFRRPVATAGKAEVPEGARNKAGLQHHFRIVNIIEKHNIAKSLMLNNDQTPSNMLLLVVL